MHQSNHDIPYTVSFAHFEKGRKVYLHQQRKAMKRFFLVSVIWVVFSCYAVYLGFTNGGETPLFLNKIQGKFNNSVYSNGHSSTDSDEHKNHEVHHAKQSSRELSHGPRKSKVRSLRKFTSEDESSEED
jgi:hypothetical protein